MKEGQANSHLGNLFCRELFFHLFLHIATRSTLRTKKCIGKS